MENPFEIIIEKLNKIDMRLNTIEEQLSAFRGEEKATNEIYDIKQVAKLLQLSVSTIYGLVHRRIIPHYKVNKRLYFNPAEILEMIEKGKVKTKDEIKKDALNLFMPRRKM